MMVGVIVQVLLLVLLTLFTKQNKVIVFIYYNFIPLFLGEEEPSWTLD